MPCSFSDSTNVRKVRCYGIKRDSKYGLRNFSYQNDLHVSYQTNFVLISWYVRGTCNPISKFFIDTLILGAHLSDSKTTLPQSESVDGLFWK